MHFYGPFPVSVDDKTLEFFKSSIEYCSSWKFYKYFTSFFFLFCCKYQTPSLVLNIAFGCCRLYISCQLVTFKTKEALVIKIRKVHRSKYNSPSNSSNNSEWYRYASWASNFTIHNRLSAFVANFRITVSMSRKGISLTTKSIFLIILLLSNNLWLSVIRIWTKFFRWRENWHCLFCITFQIKTWFY